MVNFRSPPSGRRVAGSATTGLPTDAAPGSGRIAWIDTTRGLAIAGMVAFHLDWDLAYLGFVATSPAASPAWMFFGNTVAATFLCLSGVGLALARPLGRVRALRRIGIIAGAALTVTLSTLWLFPEDAITFGILHCIVVTNLVALVLRDAPTSFALECCRRQYCGSTATCRVSRGPRVVVARSVAHSATHARLPSRSAVARASPAWRRHSPIPAATRLGSDPLLARTCARLGGTPQPSHLPHPSAGAARDPHRRRNRVTAVAIELLGRLRRPMCRDRSRQGGMQGRLRMRGRSVRPALDERRANILEPTAGANR